MTVRKAPDRYLTAIGVENFQTIKGLAWIPLGRLTLLFGPNSAGKSLIADALRVARSLWLGEQRFDSSYGIERRPAIEELQHQHWHKGEGDERYWLSDCAKLVAIHLRARVDTGYWKGRFEGLLRFGDLEQCESLAPRFVGSLSGYPRKSGEDSRNTWIDVRLL